MTDDETEYPAVIANVEHRAEGAIIHVTLPRDALSQLSEHGSLRYTIGDDGVEFGIKGLDIRNGGEVELVRLELHTY